MRFGFSSVSVGSAIAVAEFRYKNLAYWEASEGGRVNLAADQVRADAGVFAVSVTYSRLQRQTIRRLEEGSDLEGIDLRIPYVLGHRTDARAVLPPGGHVAPGSGTVTKVLT